MKLDWEGPSLTGEWSRPERDPSAVLVLTHGAGGDLGDPLLVAVAERLVAEGVATLRFNLPYREAGRRGPGSQRQSEDGYRAVVESVRFRGPRLFCGGKSYGGRIASHIAAEGVPMDGLVLCSYPLHPPGKPHRLRDAHLADVGCPLLFVQGTRDPFATPDLLERTVRRLDRARLVWIEGGDHSLRVKGRPARDVQDEVASAISRFFA